MPTIVVRSVAAGGSRRSGSGMVLVIRSMGDSGCQVVHSKPPLIETAEPGAAYEGLHLPLVASLSALPADAEAGWPLARLVDGLTKAS